MSAQFFNPNFGSQKNMLAKFAFGRLKSAGLTPLAPPKRGVAAQRANFPNGKFGFKIFSGVFLAHCVLISVVWVGFSAPAPKPPAAFTYEGALPVQETEGAKEVWQKSKTSDQFAVDHIEASYFNHWIKLRDPSKSFTYDHLGF